MIYSCEVTQLQQAGDSRLDYHWIIKHLKKNPYTKKAVLREQFPFAKDLLPKCMFKGILYISSIYINQQTWENFWIYINWFTNLIIASVAP